MRRPKRIRFVLAHRKEVELSAFYQQMQKAVTALASATLSVAEVMRKTMKAIGAALQHPDVQQELHMQQLYFQSWQRNELADTLAGAGIATVRQGEEEKMRRRIEKDKNGYYKDLP